MYGCMHACMHACVHVYSDLFALDLEEQVEGIERGGLYLKGLDDCCSVIVVVVEPLGLPSLVLLSHHLSCM